MPPQLRRDKTLDDADDNDVDDGDNPKRKPKPKKGVQILDDDDTGDEGRGRGLRDKKQTMRAREATVAASSTSTKPTKPKSIFSKTNTPAVWQAQAMLQFASRPAPGTTRKTLERRPSAPGLLPPPSRLSGSSGSQTSARGSAGIKQSQRVTESFSDEERREQDQDPDADMDDLPSGNPGPGASDGEEPAWLDAEDTTRRSSSPQSAHPRQKASKQQLERPSTSKTPARRSNQQTPARRSDQTDSMRHSDQPTPVIKTSKRTHPRPPELDTDDVVEPKKPRPAAKHYDKDMQALLEHANTYYRALICARYPFPKDSDVVELMVSEAWKYACEKKDVSVSLDANISKIVAARGSQIRGEIKTMARARAQTTYEIPEDTDRRSTREYNQKLTAWLARDLRFTYKDFDELVGMYENPIIQSIVVEILFKTRQHEGALFPELFNPIPLPTIALVLTAVENAIDEWSTGRYSAQAFTGDLYADVCHEHVLDLEAWQDSDGDATLELQQRLYHRGACRAGLLEPPRRGRLTAEALERAAAERVVRQEKVAEARRQGLYQD